MFINVWLWHDRGANNKSKYMASWDRGRRVQVCLWRCCDCGYIKFPFIHNQHRGVVTLRCSVYVTMMNELWLKLSTAIERQHHKPHTQKPQYRSDLPIPVIFDLIRARFILPQIQSELISHAIKQIGLCVQQTCKHVYEIWLAFDFNEVRSWNCHAMLKSFWFNPSFSLGYKMHIASKTAIHFTFKYLNRDQLGCDAFSTKSKYTKIIKWDFEYTNGIDLNGSLISLHKNFHNYGTHLAPKLNHHTDNLWLEQQTRMYGS